MMDHVSQGKKSDEVRNTVFNTINLINDLESGKSNKPQCSKDKKDVSLSSSFVDGIKDKLIDYSKADDPHDSKHVNGNSVPEPNKVTGQLQDKLINEISEMKKIISSNEKEIGALKDLVASLRSQIQDTSKENVQTNLDDSPFSSFSDSSEDGSIFQQRTQQHAKETPVERVEEIGSSEISQKPYADPSIFEPEPKEDTRNFTPAQDAVSVAPKDTPQNASQDVLSARKESTIQESATQESAVQTSSEAAVENADANPRVGNYESNDVLLEKYFYFGNR